MATLKELVDKTTTIKNEIASCHTALISNLKNKGVEAVSSEKLSSLISKVNSIKTGLSIAPGTSVILYKSASNISTTSQLKALSYSVNFDGGVTISFSHIKTLLYNGSVGSVTINILRNSNAYFTKKYDSKTTTSSVTLDCTDLKSGDIIEMTLSIGGQERLTVSNLAITCNFA